MSKKQTYPFVELAKRKVSKYKESGEEKEKRKQDKQRGKKVFFAQLSGAIANLHFLDRSNK